MEFCDKCGKMMKIGKQLRGFEERTIAICSCGFIKLPESEGYEETIVQKDEKGAGVVEEKHEAVGFPHECRKCGHDMADVHELGVFYGDEAGVILFKCKKCGYSERQSDGTGN